MGNHTAEDRADELVDAINAQNVVLKVQEPQDENLLTGENVRLVFGAPVQRQFSQGGDAGIAHEVVAFNSDQCVPVVLVPHLKTLGMIDDRSRLNKRFETIDIEHELRKRSVFRFVVTSIMIMIVIVGLAIWLVL